MVISKRAQIFLLAAVIISAIVISLGITANQARVSSEPKNFYDFSYEVQREVGAVMDYEIYTNFPKDNNLEEFVDIFAENIRDNNPEADFVFIYGNNNNMTLNTYNSKKSNEERTISFEFTYKNKDRMTLENFISKESDEESTISIEKFNKKIDKINKNDETKRIEGIENIIVKLKDYEFSFPVSEHPQVIFLMQKDTEDERFITGG